MFKTKITHFLSYRSWADDSTGPMDETTEEAEVRQACQYFKVSSNFQTLEQLWRPNLEIYGLEVSIHIFHALSRETSHTPHVLSFYTPKTPKTKVAHSKICFESRPPFMYT